MVTGHAGDENAAKLTRAQKEQLKEALGGPPSQSGIKAGFRDVPALRGVVKILFDVEYQSDSTYQLLLKFCGMSFKLPDTFDKRRDEAAITARMARIRQEVAELPARGWEVRAVDGVRVEHEAETRRMRLPRGGRTRLHVDRTRSARSFFGALSLTTKKMKIHPIEGNQHAERITLTMARLVRETENDKIAVVFDDAGFHHAKAVTDLYEPGQALERIKPIHLPPCAPRPQPHGARLEHRQGPHLKHPARHPGTDPLGLHQIHHQPHLRLRLRTPTNHTTRRKPRLTPAIPLPGNPHPQPPRRRAPRHDNGWRAGRASMRTSGSQGRPAQTHPRTRGQGAADRPYTHAPTRRGAPAAPPSPSSRGLFSRRIVGWTTSSRTGHRQRGQRPGVAG